MKKLFLLAALFAAATCSSCEHDDGEISTIPPTVEPGKQPQELAITFAEGNSLQFNVNETKTIHYTITGSGANTVVTAEMQNPDGAYTLSPAPTSATEGTITITAKTPSTENCVTVTVSDGDRSISAKITVSTNAIPEKEKLVITFAEGNSLEFNVGETKTVHYTITGGSDNTAVTAELQTPDDAYTVETTPTSATEGTIAITAKTPESENCVIVTVSDGDRSITASIDVVATLKASFDGKTVVVVTPGTLSQLLVDYYKTGSTTLTVIGNLNDEDIATLNSLPNLAVLDMENANLEELPTKAFEGNESLTSVKLPRTLTSIGEWAFRDCSSLTNITIPDNVTKIGTGTFFGCSSLKSITIPDGVTGIGFYAFDGCSSLTSITIPDSVTSIGWYAFEGCSNLISITIPNGVTTIGERTFQGCSKLMAVDIPGTVTSIHALAFNKCLGVKWIYCQAITPPSITGYGLISGVPSATLYVPIGSKEAYAAADEWKNFKTIIETQF